MDYFNFLLSIFSVFSEISAINKCYLCSQKRNYKNPPNEISVCLCSGSYLALRERERERERRDNMNACGAKSLVCFSQNDF